jgi:hypothetical protein
MKSFQVRVGGFYVNESKGLVREITHEEGDGNVHWRSYDLRSGRPTGDSLMCAPLWIVQWADREGTPEETARMERLDAELMQRARLIEVIEIVLKNLPDDQLFAEVKRRGYRVI